MLSEIVKTTALAVVLTVYCSDKALHISLPTQSPLLSPADSEIILEVQKKPILEPKLSNCCFLYACVYLQLYLNMTAVHAKTLNTVLFDPCLWCDHFCIIRSRSRTSSGSWSARSVRSSSPTRWSCPVSTASATSVSESCWCWTMTTPSMPDLSARCQAAPGPGCPPLLWRGWTGLWDQVGLGVRSERCVSFSAGWTNAAGRMLLCTD